MSAKDQLVPIPRADWAELRDLFRIDWPRHEVPYNTIQNYLHWVEIDPRIRHLAVFSLNGTWRENGTYIVLDRNRIYTYTLEQSCNSLKRALLALDWDYSYVITSLRECLRPSLDEVLNLLKAETVIYDHCLLYRMPKEQAIKFDINLPPGLRLRKLGIEEGVYANRFWPHKSEGTEFFLKRLACWNVSVGLFNESNDMLAWSLVRPNGCIGPLEVHPDHYRKGYGTIITKAIAREQAKAGLNCYGSVMDSNEASKAMFTKLGFKVADRHYYISNVPRKLCEWSF